MKSEHARILQDYAGTVCMCREESNYMVPDSNSTCMLANVNGVFVPILQAVSVLALVSGHL